MDTRYLLLFLKNSWSRTMNIAWQIKGLWASDLQTMARTSSGILPKKGFCRTIVVHFSRIGVSMTKIQENLQSATTNEFKLKNMRNDNERGIEEAI